MSDKKKKLKVGKDAVVIGDIDGNIGDGSVVVGPTDDKGNVILNQPMAVGRNAHAGLNSIAIGANAGAGAGIGLVFHEIGKIIQSTNDPSLIESFADLVREIDNPNKNKSKISALWDTLKKSAVLSGAIQLVSQASEFIKSIC